MEPRRYAYESMGTHWAVTIWDAIDPLAFDRLMEEIVRQSHAFDQTFSRFIPSSLVWNLSAKQGTVEVPPDLVAMLRLYRQLHALTGGALNPLVGFTLSDMGYDAEYSLTPKATIRPVPDLEHTIEILDDTHIELRAQTLIDIGALGKGFFVDKIASFLRSHGIKRFLVDGSGDIFYEGNGEPIRAGLEDPGDPTKAIGVIPLTHRSLCASAGSRRRWSRFHHIIDPRTLFSPLGLLATWTVADSAALADGLATCLFLVPPEQLGTLPFEYCLLNEAYRVKRSVGFDAELL